MSAVPDTAIFEANRVLPLKYTLLLALARTAEPIAPVPTR